MAELNGVWLNFLFINDMVTSGRPLNKGLDQNAVIFMKEHMF